MKAYELILELARFDANTEVEFHVKAEFDTDVEAEFDRENEDNTQEVTVTAKFDEYVTFDDIEDNELRAYRPNVVINAKLQEADLTDAEKIQKALKDAEDSKVEFAKKSNKLDAEKILVATGLTEEDYKDLIDGIVSDNEETTKALATSLAGMVSKQKEGAIQKTKEELMDGTHTPGGEGGSGGDDKSEDVKFAEEIAKSFSVNQEDAKSVFDNY